MIEEGFFNNQISHEIIAQYLGDNELQGIEALILAGTELPLLLRGAEPTGLPFLDTTMIHVDAAVEAILR